MPFEGKTFQPTRLPFSSFWPASTWMPPKAFPLTAMLETLMFSPPEMRMPLALPPSEMMFTALLLELHHSLRSSKANTSPCFGSLL